MNDKLEIIQKLDKYMEDKSLIIPVEMKKNGDFSAKSSIIEEDNLKLISNYVNAKVQKIGRNILQGDKQVSPYTMGDKQACTYCSYKKVCGFDPLIPGYQSRILQKLDDESILKKMEEELL